MSTRKRLQISVLLIALALPFTILSSPFSVNGQLHVTGNQLVNECGSAVQLRGISSHGLRWYGLIDCFDFCCISASALDYMVNTIGIDMFRIAVYPEPNGYISNPSKFTQDVNNIVQMCEDRGIYALIDWHILTPGDPNASITYARTFWESMALAHKDRRNVIYEICNEPNGVSWSQVVTYANDIIPRIRAIDPDAVIVVGTPNWSQLGSDVVNNKLTFSNIMYAFHFYAATHDTSMLTNYIGQLPIFVSEWAATEASGAGGTNYTRADSFVSIMATNKISWAAWSWSEAPETSGMLNAGACDAANWSNYKPTGSYVVGKVSNPADSFTVCAIATNTPTPAIVPTEVVPATDLRLDSITDGDYVSNICSNWYSYDDSNDCTDKDCVANPHGNSQIVPWSKDHWQDLGLPVQNFFMSQPGRNGGTDFAARITGVVTNTFLYGFAGLGFPLKEPEGPVNISTATGLSFWCKSNQSRTFRLKINSPQAFGGKLDEDMYGYVFTATTSWQKVSVVFSSLLFSQEGWGDTTVTKAMALSAVDTIQWQTQGQTGAPYNFDLWVDDVVLINAPAALKTVAATGCGPTSTPVYTRTASATKTRTATRTSTGTVTRTSTAQPSFTNTPANTFTFTRTATGTATLANTATFTRTPVISPTFTRSATPTITLTVTRTNTPYYSQTFTVTPTSTRTPSFTGTVTSTVTVTRSHTASPTISQTLAGTPPTYTYTPTITMTLTNLPTSADTATPSFTLTAETATNTPVNTATFTLTQSPVSTVTFTQTTGPSSTDTPVSTVTYTKTTGPSPTDTPENSVTHTPTTGPSLTNTPVNTATDIPTEAPTPVNTPVDTPTSNPTMAPTATNTPADTFTAIPTATYTPENTYTQTPTASYTPTNISADTPTQTPVPGDAESFEITDTIIYPNPYNPALGMGLAIKADFSQKHGNVKVRFYTPALRCIRTYDFPASPWAGKRTLDIAASGFEGLANGCYYYVITAENGEGQKAKSEIPSLVILK